MLIKDTTRGGFLLCLLVTGSFELTSSLHHKKGASEGGGSSSKTLLYSLTIAYTGDDTDGYDNHQYSDKFYYDTPDSWPSSVQISTSIDDVQWTSVEVGHAITMTNGGSKFPADSILYISSMEGALISTINFHTSCSHGGLQIDDRLGPFQVTSMSTNLCINNTAQSCNHNNNSLDDNCITVTINSDNQINDGRDGEITVSSVPVTTSDLSQQDKDGGLVTTSHPVQTTTSPSFLTTTPNPSLQPTPEPSREPTFIPSSNPTTPSPTPPPQVVGQPVIDITTEQTTTGNGPRITQGPGATCEVAFYDPSASPRGTCPASASPVDVTFVESSVGFTTQVCHQHQSDATGNPTMLYMTVQPVCSDGGSTQRWSVCSWQPDPQSLLCSATNQECCNYVSNHINVPGISAEDLSCQEYEVGECNSFFGFNPALGEAQEYSIQLVECIGTVLRNPQCSRRLEGSSPFFSDQAKSNAVILAGIGLITIAAAMALRRHRRQRSAEAFIGQPVGPSEDASQPLINSFNNDPCTFGTLTMPSDVTESKSQLM